MSVSESTKLALRTLPDLPSDEKGPVFAEPWQAQAFAMAVCLNEAGYFTWSEWADHLGVEIAKAGYNDDPDNYFGHWLTALEKIIQTHGLVNMDERLNHQEAWNRAAKATPHGEPIRLGRELE